MIKVLLFDLDGVIANGEPFSKQLASQYGITQDMTAHFFRGRFLDCLVGKADLKEELEVLLQDWGWEKSTEEFLREWFEYEHRLDTQLLSFVEQLRARGKHCYIATNQEQYRTTYALNEMGLDRQFDGIFSSVHAGYMKNEPAFFEYVLQQLPGVQANEVLFWDDSPGNVETARRVGLQAEIYTGFADFVKKMDGYMISSDKLPPSDHSS